MNDASTAQSFDIPVEGGLLRAVRWGSSRGASVIASHGLTGSHLAWSRVAELLPAKISLVAVDHRGRGASETLPGPFGMEAHARDLIAVADELGISRAVFAGNSMGAWITTVVAAQWPARARGLVLVDGGLANDHPIPTGVDQQLHRSLGPGFDRLNMTFPTRDTYRDYWKAHPAFSAPGAWNSHVESYVDYDLAGCSPQLRSRASLDAVRADAMDLRANDEVNAALDHVTCPMVLIRAAHGAMTESGPAVTEEMVAEARARGVAMTDVLIPGVNHLTILHSTRGAEAIARCIVELANGQHAPIPNLEVET